MASVVSEFFHVILHYLRMQLSKEFTMWVTSGSYVGHIQIVLWVSGSTGSTGVTHFQPCCLYVFNSFILHNYIEVLYIRICIRRPVFKAVLRTYVQDQFQYA